MEILREPDPNRTVFVHHSCGSLSINLIRPQYLSVISLICPLQWYSDGVGETRVELMFIIVHNDLVWDFISFTSTNLGTLMLVSSIWTISILFNQFQTSERTYIESTFGILNVVFYCLGIPFRLQKQDEINNIVYTCIWLIKWWWSFVSIKVWNIFIKKTLLVMYNGIVIIQFFQNWLQ